MEKVPPSQLNIKEDADESADPGSLFNREADQVNHTDNQNESRLVNILPSYYMYSNTINTAVNELASDPPIYERHNSSQSLLSHQSIFSTPPSASYRTDSTSTSNTTGNSSMDDLFERNHIKDNVIDNLHKIKNLTNSSNEMAKAVRMSVVFTKEIGQYNVEPEIIDPKDFEFSQGDTLYGHVLIQNTSNKPISFDMFYTVLEGQLSISNPTGSAKTVKVFLQMFDFQASYNSADISENNHVNSRCPPSTKYIEEWPSIYDPSDNTVGCFSPQRLIMPNITYKRFFIFKLPEKLLDSECEDNLDSHVSLLPTMGKWKTIKGTEVKDFGFVNTSIKYSVCARFIGRYSRYTKNNHADEYAVLKAAESEFRVLPSGNNNRPDAHYCKLGFQDIVKTLEEKIEECERILVDPSIPQSQSNPNTAQNSGEIMRRQKSITTQSDMMEKMLDYDFYYPISKASLRGKHQINTLNVKFPRDIHTIDYIPQCGVGRSAVDPRKASSWIVEIPIDMFISCGGGNKEVNVTKAEVEFSIVTVAFPTKRIPIELHQDMLFNQVHKPIPRNQPNDDDDINCNIVSKVRPLANKLIALTKNLRELGYEYMVERKLMQGAMSLSNLSTKVINLEVPNVQTTGDAKWVPNGSTSLRRSMKLKVDISSAHTKGLTKFRSSLNAYDQYHLVPDFQSCHMCRFYFLRINLNLDQGQSVRFKVPVKIVHRN